MPTIHNACARCCREHVTPSFDNVSFQTETNMPNKLEDNLCCAYNRASQLVLVVKNPPANAGDIGVVGLIPGLGRFPGGGNGNPLQYSCLENAMDRGARQATAHGATELDTTEAT